MDNIKASLKQIQTNIDCLSSSSISDFGSILKNLGIEFVNIEKQLENIKKSISFYTTQYEELYLKVLDISKNEQYIKDLDATIKLRFNDVKKLNETHAIIKENITNSQNEFETMLVEHNHKITNLNIELESKKKEIAELQKIFIPKLNEITKTEKRLNIKEKDLKIIEERLRKHYRKFNKDFII